jgi:hypothetical protein
MSIDVPAKLREHELLKAARSPHEPVWRDCFDYTHPVRGEGFYNDVPSAGDAQSRKAKLVDATSTDAARICASMIHSGLTPANSRWFQLAVDNVGDEENRWLDAAADVLWKNIHMANFDAAGFEASQDGVDAGWFVLYIGENKQEGGFHFEQWPISQCYIATSTGGGLVDIIHRRYVLTASQCIAEFGEDAVSQNVRSLAEKGDQSPIEILHIIEPRQTYAVNAKLSKNMPFASYHIEVREKNLLRESGYHEFPAAVPRWMLIPGSCYATGPVADALPTIKRLNEMSRFELAAAEVAVAGMWIAEDDGVLNPRTVKVGPRKVIVANSVESMKALETGSNFQVSEMTIDKMQAQIRKILMADQLQPQDGPAMTATEVHVRVNLIRQLLGPVYGRLQSEYLTTMVTRCFGIAYRAGVFTPPPPSLAGRNFTVRYISPLARAQKLEEVSAIQQYVTATIQVGAVVPEVMDNVDFDAANRIAGQALGVPSDVIRKTADRDKLRQQRTQAQQEAAQQEQMAALTQEAGKAAVTQAVA